MSYVTLISVTQAQFDALKTTGTPLDRPVVFFITDAAAGVANVIFGRTGQTATAAQSTGAVAAGAAAGVVQNNFAATVAPTTANGSGQGYAVGSRWIDVTADESYICTDATVGASLWSKSTVGTIAEVAGLQAALDAKASAAHTHVKADVGLGNVDNTSDVNKPISTQTQNALNTKYDQAQLPIDLSTKADLSHTHADKQDALVSGTNIKTLNSQSILGSGNIAVGASSASVTLQDGGTGGTVTQVGNDRVHTFTASGSFVVPAGVTAVQVLAVGGGGGGGGGHAGGGGGAGRFMEHSALPVTPGATLAVVVGAGGTGSDAVGNGQTNGGASSIAGVTAPGGGRGAGSEGATASAAGGSGGGGSGGNSTACKAGSTAVGGSGGSPDADGSGNGGGANTLGNTVYGVGAGGGGAGGVSASVSGGSGVAGGQGGAGLTSTITGTAVGYAGGGGGGGWNAAGGVATSGGGAGGSGATGSGVAGTANLGGGGGGSNAAGTSRVGGAGGSGVVIVRYIYQSLDTPVYANNAAAVAGGLTLGQLYRTGADPDVLCVVH